MLAWVMRTCLYIMLHVYCLSCLCSSHADHMFSK